MGKVSNSDYSLQGQKGDRTSPLQRGEQKWKDLEQWVLEVKTGETPERGKGHS